jgi:hypothetical protein
VYLFIYLFISVFSIMHKDTINYNLIHSKIKNIHYLPMSTRTTIDYNIELSIYEYLCEDVITLFLTREEILSLTQMYSCIGDCRFRIFVMQGIK